MSPRACAFELLGSSIGLLNSPDFDNSSCVSSASAAADDAELFGVLPSSDSTNLPCASFLSNSPAKSSAVASASSSLPT